MSTKCEHEWIEITTASDSNIRYKCSKCGSEQTLPRYWREVLASFKPPAWEAEVSRIVGSPIQILDVQPGDVVILSYPGILSQAAKDNISEAWLDVWGDREQPTLKVIVLEEGMTVNAVLRAGANAV